MAVWKPFFQFAVCPKTSPFFWRTYFLVDPPLHGCTVSLVSESRLPYLSLSLNKGMIPGSFIPPKWNNATKPVSWKVMWVPVDQNKIAVGQRISNITIFGLQHVENEFISKALFRQHIKDILFLPTQNTLCLIRFYCIPAFFLNALNTSWSPAEHRTEFCCHMSCERKGPEIKLYSQSCCWLLIDFWQLAQERNTSIEMY